jgi:hypothetical protein
MVCECPEPPEPVQCPVPPTPAPIIKEVKVEVPVPVAVPAPVRKIEKQLVGSAEYVELVGVSMRLSARIDTGAETSSLYARQIKTFERDGQDWVRFTIVEPSSKQSQVVEREVTRFVRIKQTEGDSERRPVVVMLVVLGDIRELMEFTLADRSDYEFPVLVGRNILRDRAVVDVSSRYMITDQEP